MWVTLGFLLFVGATAVTSFDSQPAWELGQEYKYVLRSHTFSALGQHDKIQNQLSGIVISAILTLQVKSSDTLVGNLANAQYAQVHKVLPEGMESISDNKLDYQTLPLKGENFMIHLKREQGMVRQLMLDPQTPTWEVNLLKSIASQLQLDTLGKNAISAQGTQIPTVKSPFGLYTVFEQSIGGNCEVLYDVAPLSEEDQLNPKLVPNQKLVQNREILIDIKKTKNYQTCKDLKVQSLNMDKNTKILSRLSTSRNIISGSLKKFTIQSSLMTSNIHVSLDKNSGLGTVLTKSNMTLRAKREIRRPIETSSTLMPVNDLMYSFECSMDSLSMLEERQQSSNEFESSSKKFENLKYVLRGFDRSPHSSSEELNRPHQNESSSNMQLSMNELPKSPLLFDVGCAAKQLTGEQRISKVREIIQDMINDFESSDKDLSSTPSKYLFVVKLMRTLGIKSLNRLKQQLQEDNLTSKSVTPKITTLNVFYNALSQAGTAPALFVVMQAIEEKQFQGSEAERAISNLDTTVRLLTKEIIETVCDLMSKPTNILKKTAPLVCGKLLRKATMKTSSNIQVSDLDVEKLLSRYTSVMDLLLLQALKDNDVSQAYTLVLGLGNTANPMILSVLEPYLEGTYLEDSLMRVKKLRDVSSEEIISSEKDTSRNIDISSTEDTDVMISKQLRKLMVIVLGEVVKYNPSRSRAVALKLYLNQQESPELRCIAANFYIMSNPSLIGLMHIAKFANIDSNREVSSCIKTSLVNVADRQPLSGKQRDLGNKARIAVRFLDRTTIKSIWRSMIEDIFSIFFKPDISLILGNSNTNVPSSAYLRMEPYTLRSDMRMISFAYDVSNMRQFMEKIMSSGERQKTLMMDKTPTPQDFVQIMHEVKLKPKDKKHLEGFMYMETMLGSLLYFFNDSSLDADLKKLKEVFQENKPYNLIRMDAYDELLSLPVETGMPFVFTVEKPTITLINAVGQKQEKRDSSEIRGNVNVLQSSNVQYKIGFVTPFDHQKYVSGIDNTVSVVVPLTFNVQTKEENKETHMSVKLSPSQQLSTNNKLLLLSNTPFTSTYNVLEFVPVLRSANTHSIQVSSELKKDMIHLGPFRLIMEVDTASSRNIRDLFTNMIKPSFYNYNIALQTHLRPKEEISSHIVYAKQNKDLQEDSNVTQEDLQEDSNVTQENLQEDSNITQEEYTDEKESEKIVDKQPNSKKRRQQFLTQSKKGIKSAISRVVDVSVRTPAHKDQSVTNYVLTVALANSQVNSNARVLAYCNSQTKSEDIQLEGNFNGLAKWKPVMLETLEQAVKFVPDDKFTVDMEFRNQSKEMKLKFIGVLTQSANLKEVIQTSKTVQQCLQAMKGNEGLQSCKNALELVNKKDNFKLSVKFDKELSKQLNETKIIRKIIDIIPFKYINSVNIVNNLKNVDKDVVDIEVKTPFNAEHMDLTLRTPKANIAFSTPKQYGQTLPHLFLQEKSTCHLSRKEISTFDNMSYRPVMGQCWHIMSATTDQSSVTIPLVLIKDNYKKGILATVIARYGARFNFRNEDGALLLLLDSKPILSTSRASAYVGYRLRIWSTPTSLKLITDDNNFEFTYTGSTVEVKISDTFRNQLTGICGNNDGILANDLVRQNCQLDTPEFVASFALLSKDCEGPALFNKKKAEMSLAACDQRQIRQSNIISDKEAGRIPRQNKNWGHGITSLTRDQSDLIEHRTWYEYNATYICFSIEPVPQCLVGTKAKIIEEKEFNYHCGPMTNKNMELKNSIDQGAHPDLSHKSVTKTELLFVPKVCTKPEDSDV